MALYSSDRARRSVFDTVGLRITSQIASMFATIVLVRSISEQDFSAYSLLYATIPLFATLASLGIDQSLRRFQPEYLSGGAAATSAWLVRTAAVLRLVSNLLLIALLLLAWNWLAPLIGIASYKFDFLLFGGVLLLYFQVNVLQFSLSSLMLHRFSMGAIAAMSIAKLLLYALLGAGGTLHLTTAIAADIIAYGTAYTLLLWAYLRTRERGSGGRRPSDVEKQRVTRFARVNYLNDAASLLVYAETDRFFIASMLGPLAVGAYAAATRVMDMISTLSPTRLLDSVLQPLFFSVAKQDAKERIPRYFTLMINAGMAFQLPFMVFTIAFHREIFQLAFGDKFQDSSYLLPLVVGMSTVELVFSLPITMVAHYLERPGLILRSQLAGGYQIVAMLVLLPWIGLPGAAISTGTFHLIRNLYVWWHVRALARWSNWRRAALIGVSLWAAVMLACLLLKATLTAPGPVLLAAGAVLCVIGLLAHARSAAVSPSDRRLLSGLLHGRESRLLQLIGLSNRNSQ